MSNGQFLFLVIIGMLSLVQVARHAYLMGMEPHEGKEHGAYLFVEVVIIWLLIGVAAMERSTS